MRKGAHSPPIAVSEMGIATVYAYFTKGFRSSWVAFYPSYDLRGLQPTEMIVVSGKKEARKIASERGAQCWNF